MAHKLPQWLSKPSAAEHPLDDGHLPINQGHAAACPADRKEKKLQVRVNVNVNANIGDIALAIAMTVHALA